MYWSSAETIRPARYDILSSESDFEDIEILNLSLEKQRVKYNVDREIFRVPKTEWTARSDFD